MAALFAAIRHANMSDADYVKSQFARNIPAMGRPQDFKRHQENIYRRSVLRELVAWWVGAQPGRALGEIHKRFYYRFGIDIGTAFTLKATDTDALIESIKNKFIEDLK